MRDLTIAELDQAQADLMAHYSRDPDMLELERTIVALIARKYAATEGSAEWRMVMRQLAGLRYSREEAGPIMEDLDPSGWGAFSDHRP